jgi:CRP-like cAMP-binding protein
MTGNRFLDALPPELAAECVDRAEPRAFAPDDYLVHRGDPVNEIYFPLRGAVSEIEEGLDGGSNEVTAIGPEGFCGLESILDVPACPFLRLNEVRTDGLAVATAFMLNVRDRSPEFLRLVQRYAVARLHEAGISIGCNARHDARSRLARWLRPWPYR